MNQQSIDIPLHDIMPLVDVPDMSIYWFSALVVISLLIFTGGMMWFTQWKRAKNINKRQAHYEILQNIDLENPKQSAYIISKEALFFAYDNEQMLNGYKNLFTRLEPYKYAPTVEKIDEETIGYYYQYLEMIDV